jgi:hypothetical protein
MARRIRRRSNPVPLMALLALVEATLLVLLVREGSVLILLLGANS